MLQMMIRITRVTIVMRIIIMIITMLDAFENCKNNDDSDYISD